MKKSIELNFKDVKDFKGNHNEAIIVMNVNGVVGFGTWSKETFDEGSILLDELSCSFKGSDITKILSIVDIVAALEEPEKPVKKSQKKKSFIKAAMRAFKNGVIVGRELNTRMDELEKKLMGSEGKLNGKIRSLQHDNLDSTFQERVEKALDNVHFHITKGLKNKIDDMKDRIKVLEKENIVGRQTTSNIWLSGKKLNDLMSGKAVYPWEAEYHTGHKDTLNPLLVADKCGITKKEWDALGKVMYEWNDERLPKPPLGLKPQYIWREERVSEIWDAIIRKLDVGLEVPDAWFFELKELNKELDNSTIK